MRLYQTGDLDLETVGNMLWRTDKQANFHPENRWLETSSYGTEEKTERLYREFFVRWIGREPVIMWLTSNQILYEVTSYAILPQEEDAIQSSYAGDQPNTPSQIN